MSDAVLLAIVGGVVTLATIYLKSRIDAKAILAAAVAKEEAAKVQAQLDKVEVKIDGRLTELLETTRQLAEAQGLAQGKAEGRDDQKADIKEIKKEGLNIAAGSVDITTHEVNVGEKKEKKKPDKPKTE